mgnify:CR=1 FL=1
MASREELESCRKVLKVLISKGSEVQAVSQKWADEVDPVLNLGSLKEEYFEAMERIIDIQQQILQKVDELIEKDDEDFDDFVDNYMHEEWEEEE